MANDRLREAQALSNALPGFWDWLKAGHQMTGQGLMVQTTANFMSTVAKQKKNNHGS